MGGMSGLLRRRVFGDRFAGWKCEIITPGCHQRETPGSPDSEGGILFRILLMAVTSVVNSHFPETFPLVHICI